MVTLQKLNSYHNINSYHSFIYDKNQFSGIPINKPNHLRHLSLNDLSFNDNSYIKTIKRKRNKSNKFSDFTKIFEKTFTISNKNIFDTLNSKNEKKLFNKIHPVNNIDTITIQENKRSKSTLNKKKSGSNSTININLNTNKNKKILSKEYVNKNFYKVFGKNNDKTYRIFNQISQIKNNLSPKIVKQNLINRPKVEVKDSKIINEYNKNAISIHKKINNLMKPHKRNLSNLEDYNNRNNFINKSFHKTNIFKNNKNRINSISNFTNYKNNIVKVAYIDLFNDNNNDPQKEIEVYKNSFKVNKSKDFIIQKYLNNSKKK
jgi:hypothetical protein